MTVTHLIHTVIFRKNVVLPFCHLWYNNSEVPEISPVTNFQNIYYGGNYLNPHILGCYPPDSMKHIVPVSVSLVETECPKSKPSNNIQVHFDRHKSGHKQGIAVCSKALTYLGDVSMRIIEWIELLRAQGVEKVILSVLAVHPNVKKVSFIVLMENFKYLTDLNHFILKGER